MEDLLMKKIKTVLAAVTSSVLIVSVTSAPYSSAVDLDTFSESKISDNLSDIMLNANDSELIPVGIELFDLDGAVIDEMIERSSDFKVADYLNIETYSNGRMNEIIIETENKYGFEKAHVTPLRNDEEYIFVSDIYYSSDTAQGKLLSEMEFNERTEYITSGISEKEKMELAESQFGMSLVTKSISDDIEEYMQVRRENVLKAYKNYNKAAVDKYIADENIITNVGFAPFLIVQANKSQINALESDKNVVNISYFPEEKFESEMYNTLSTSNIPNMQNSGYEYTGVGVKVGILEADSGKFNSQYTLLSGCQNLNYVYSGSTDEGVVSDHATKVTSIIKAKQVTYNGRTYKGVAPDSIVYQTYTNSNYTLSNRLEFLASKGVSVVNMSAGTNTGAEYAYADWIVDNAINNLGIVFVKSAGNTGNYVTSPGKAYNAITVGNCNTTTSAPYSMLGTSAYIEESGIANKPDIAAPGTYISFPYMSSDSGTSYAAPVISGVAAQMIQCMPSLKLPSASQNSYGGKTYFNTVKALLTLGANYQCISTTNNATKMTGSNSNFIRDKSGAGLVDAKKTMDIILENGYTRRIKSISLSSNGTSSNGMTFYRNFTELEKIRAVLCYSKINRYSNSNLDLELHDPYATVLVHSSSSVNNVEIIEYQFPASEAYEISAEIISSNVSANEILAGALVYYKEN